MIQKVALDINIYNKNKILGYKLNLSFYSPASYDKALQYLYFEPFLIFFTVYFDKFCMDEESWEKN